ncbi:MAG: class I SAM-dependent methyltransferase [Deltaproteobacteria bacterium]|nr:class I SAM-dependent methyltransferase [Deltaproteobacteria bacterium]
MREDIKKQVGTVLRKLAEAKTGLGALLVDSGNRLLGQTDDSYPPARLHFVGGGNFGGTGYEFLRYFIELGGMKRTDRVLDVGSGVGRMAIPMTNYLKHGSYLGFDIVPEGVKWCQQKITPKYPNFQFALADIYSERYNPKGTQDSTTFRFPVDDESVDFVFLTSVFTHLLLPEATHYLKEIGRVLKKGGRVLGTWFLLNEESRKLMVSAPNSPGLVYPMDGNPDVLVYSLDIPRGAVGFSETLVRQLHAQAGLKIAEPWNPGSWCGRADFLSYQDIVVATK